MLCQPPHRIRTGHVTRNSTSRRFLCQSKAWHTSYVIAPSKACDKESVNCVYGCVVAGRASLALHLARAGHVKRFCLLLSPSSLAEADGLDLGLVAGSTPSTPSTPSTGSGDALTSSPPPPSVASRLLTSRLLQGIFLCASTIACECSR